jgi:DNA-binding transcriptional ArsR family regulator
VHTEGRRVTNDDAEHEPGALPTLDRADVTDYQAASDLLRALSAPLRLALVDLLIDSPRCVHELVDALSVSQPLVSQHLKTLRAAGLVTTQRRGREVVYHLVDHHVAHVARDILVHSREPQE